MPELPGQRVDQKGGKEVEDGGDCCSHRQE